LTLDSDEASKGISREKDHMDYRDFPDFVLVSGGLF
jgi:hypothetical protein